MSGKARLGLVAVVVLVSTGCASRKYEPELNRWKQFCGFIQAPPEVTFDDELSGNRSDRVMQLFDFYVLSESPDRMPSSVRDDVMRLRQVVGDLRSGEITADEARRTGLPAIQKLGEEDRNGACAYLKSRPEGVV